MNIIPIKQSIINKFNQNNFIYLGINLSAFTDTKGDIKKKSVLPEGYMDINAPLIKPIYNKETKTNIDPNGISILTEKSALSIIDVDKPNDCPILDKLLIDCQWIHKTRKGYHFIFKKNDLPRKKQCGIIDVNTALIHFVPEYKHRETKEVIGNYEIIKSEGIVEMPKYAYDYCEEMIKTHCGRCVKTTEGSIPKLSKKNSGSPFTNNNKLNLDI